MADGVFRFILNGLRHANGVLGSEEFKLEDWEVIGEYVYDNEGGRHQAFYSPVRDTTVLGETIKAHERIQVEQSLKYSKDGMQNLWRAAGVVESDRWMVEGDEYGELLSLSRSAVQPETSLGTNLFEDIWTNKHPSPTFPWCIVRPLGIPSSSSAYCALHPVSSAIMILINCDRALPSFFLLLTEFCTRFHPADIPNF